MFFPRGASTTRPNASRGSVAAGDPRGDDPAKVTSGDETETKAFALAFALAFVSSEKPRAAHLASASRNSSNESASSSSLPRP